MFAIEAFEEVICLLFSHSKSFSDTYQCQTSCFSYDISVSCTWMCLYYSLDIQTPPYGSLSFCHKGVFTNVRFYRFCTPANKEIVMLMMTVMLDWALPFH